MSEIVFTIYSIGVVEITSAAPVFQWKALWSGMLMLKLRKHPVYDN